MLISEKIAEQVVSRSGISKEDTVFEIGTGGGMLTKYISKFARSVVTCELDNKLMTKTSGEFSHLRNVTFFSGDAFSPPLSDTKFDLCITSLPYSRSRDFLIWLSLHDNRQFKKCTAIIQSEFADKLLAKPGTSTYRAVSAIAQLLFEMKVLMNIRRDAFEPPPEVDSELIEFVPFRNDRLKSFSIAEVKHVNMIFSFRGRLLRSAIRKSSIPENRLSAIPDELVARRVEQLTPLEFLKICEVLSE